MPGQAGAVAAGPFDRPCPHHRILVGNSTSSAYPAAVAATMISPRTPPVALSMTAAEWVWTWVDADHDIDHLTQIGQTGHAFSPSPDGTWFRSGTKARQDCDGTHPAPLTPGGQAPNQASSFNRTGASNRERTCRTKGKMPVLPGVTPAVTNPQPTTSRLRRRSSQSLIAA